MISEGYGEGNKMAYLEEDLAEYPVSLFFENGREDDGNTVGSGLNVDGFLVAIMEGH